MNPSLESWHFAKSGKTNSSKAFYFVLFLSKIAIIKWKNANHEMEFFSKQKENKGHSLREGHFSLDKWKG